MSTLHLRYGGNSYDFEMSTLDVGDLSSDQDLKQAIATNMDIPVTKLSGFEVDRSSQTGDITIRPQAVFG